MKIISSQHYIDWNIVEKKISELKGMDSIEIPCCEIGEIDGEEYAVQVDGHHTLAAARELEIPVEFTLKKIPMVLRVKNISPIIIWMVIGMM